MKYFTTDEFRCKCGCGLYLPHPTFETEVDRLREQFGHPLIVSSGCRCKTHNDKVKGHPLSLHIGDKPAHSKRGQTGFMAFDTPAGDGFLRGNLFSVAWKLGWSIGWSNAGKFTHFDRRVDLGMTQSTFDY